MILANITVPLLGFVDTAVIGHLDSSDYLSGVALGSLVITISFWLLGFLRMSTTALASQAHGRNNQQQLIQVIHQGGVLALGLAAFILAVQAWLFELMLLLVESTEQMTASLYYAKQYFDIRIWIAPISLLNLVLTGYLIGIGRTKQVLMAVVVCNIVNVVGDILFVPLLNWDVAGVAYASILAELSQFAILLKFSWSLLKRIRPFDTTQYRGMWALMAMNRVLFVRSALLQFCISFMTIYASRFGPNAVAVNAILMQFFLFLSFALDGIAFAIESLVGQQFGRQQSQKLRLFIIKGLRFGFAFACLYSLIYVMFAEPIFRLMTDIESLVTALSSYYPIVILLPLGSFMCFILDGVFVGLGWAKEMRNSMFIATVAFVAAALVNRYWGGENVGLWLCFWLFLLMRGVSQWWMLKPKLGDLTSSS